MNLVRKGGKIYKKLFTKVQIIIIILIAEMQAIMRVTRRMTQNKQKPVRIRSKYTSMLVHWRNK